MENKVYAMLPLQIFELNWWLCTKRILVKMVNYCSDECYKQKLWSKLVTLIKPRYP